MGSLFKPPNMKNFFKIVLGTMIGSILAFIAALFILAGVIGSIASLSDTKPTVPKSVVLALDFKTSISEQGGENPFSMLNPLSSSGTKSTSLYHVVRSIERAKQDPSIKYIYMNLTYMSCSITHLEEIRAALERFRESGKPIIAYADNYSQAAYYLATVADKIYLSPSGMVPLSGISINTIFFKDLLDKLGVEFQLVRHGKFKAAAEQYISNSMSAENREQLQAYVDAVWSSWSSKISDSREISLERLNYITDNLLLSTASQALKEGLVDELLYKDQLIEKLTALFGVEKEKDLKLISLEDYDKATNKINLKLKEKVAILYANGEITMGKSANGISSDLFVDQISKIRRDSSIKAVVFRVNSPGGSAQSSDLIGRELELLMKEKPVIVSMGDYAASGGYWISAKANKIFTNNTTLTGSIGVFSLVPNAKKGMERHLHLKTQAVNSNKYSDLMSGYRPLEDKESEFLRSAVEEIYNEFINLVSQGRGISVEEVDNIAQGRVWAGSDALKIGLADSYGGLYDAINYASTAANLVDYRIVEYPVQKSTMEKIMEMVTETSEVATALSDPLELIKNSYKKVLESQGVSHMARLPFNIEYNY